MQGIATRALVLALGLTGAALLATQTVQPALSQSGEGWIQLFDGKTLGDWDRVGESNWRVEEGAIVAGKRAGQTAAPLGSQKQ